MSFCVNCGNEVLDEYEFCPECGAKAVHDNQKFDEAVPEFENHTTKYKKCMKCGKDMPEDAFYCLNCGTSFGKPTTGFGTVVNNYNINVQNGKWKNKWISLLLCFFLGMFGAHRFYEGKIITGIIYFLTFGILGFGWFVDIIRIILKPNPYWVK